MIYAAKNLHSRFIFFILLFVFLCYTMVAKEVSFLKKRMMALLLIGCLAFSTTPIPGFSEAKETDNLRLICLNIGKADCMLLLYQKEAYLIDTGYTQTYAALKTMLAQYGVERLNGVFLSHCHEDHDGGLTQLAKSDAQVDAWYAARIYYDLDKTGHPAVLAAAERNETVTWLDAGNVISVGSDASFTVLGPLTVNKENENNNSLVMRFSSPQGSILFAGDMKQEEENELLAANAFSSCDVLKVGHHGDSSATSKAMLKAVRPKIAVILTSTEEEPDTPADSAVKRLNNVGCTVYVSQDAQDALLITLKKGSVPTVQNLCWEDVPKRAESITLTMDVDKDTLTIRNDGDAPLSLTGCLLYSSRGDNTLDLPDAVIAPGASYIIGSNSTKGKVDLRWDVKKAWNAKKRVIAILYDAYGRPFARTDNGLAE